MFKRIFGRGYGHYVALYVPSTVNVNVSMEDNTAEQYIREVQTFLNGLFGGSTATKAVGSWNSDTFGLVSEDVTIVYAYSPRLSRKHLMQVRDYALSLKHRLSQEAIAVEIDGKLYFVG